MPYYVDSAGGANSYDNWTREPRWDFTIDDNNNDPNDMFNWWINGGNNLNDLMMQLVGNNSSTATSSNYTQYRLVTPKLLVTRRIAEQGLDNLMFKVDGNNSYIESTGDERGMHISSKTGNKIYIGDNNDKIIIGGADTSTDQNPSLNLEVQSNGITTIGLSNADIWDHLYFLHDGAKAIINVGGAVEGIDFRIADENTIANGFGNQNYQSKFSIHPDKIITKTQEVTLNYGGVSDLTKVSINTDKKVDNVALTIAGATYIGPKAELAAANTLGKFKPEYLNTFNLWVEDGIVTEDIAIVAVDEWKDIVFSDGYKLKTLKDVETYIKINKHLPGVKSEAEVKKEGYSVKKMNIVLLEKVEELTLYAIEQEKRIKSLEKKLEKLEKLVSNNNK